MAEASQLVKEHESKQKKLCFHILGLTVLNSYIIVSSYSSKIYKENLLEMSAREPCSQSTPTGRPNPQASQMRYLETQHTEPLEVAGSHLWPDAHVAGMNKPLPNSSASKVQS
jgi:hypothetical protein